jgi:hypothetical protein
MSIIYLTGSADRLSFRKKTPRKKIALALAISAVAAIFPSPINSGFRSVEPLPERSLIAEKECPNNPWYRALINFGIIDHRGEVLRDSLLAEAAIAINRARYPLTPDANKKKLYQQAIDRTSLCTNYPGNFNVGFAPLEIIARSDLGQIYRQERQHAFALEQYTRIDTLHRLAQAEALRVPFALDLNGQTTIASQHQNAAYLPLLQELVLRTSPRSP